MRYRMMVISVVFATCSAAAVAARGAEPEIAFEQHPDRLEITVGGQPWATYVFRDEKTLRPYFANVHAPGGALVTRRHPANPDDEGGDHATMHPGIWLAFGDISGGDFWRNRASVVHTGFEVRPHVEGGRGRFAVKNEYRHDGRLVCREICRYTLTPAEGGILLTSDSTFDNDDEAFTFGDQEELGLGVRVNRRLRVKGGEGRILNADGLRDEKQVWGKATDWCDYSGPLDGRFVGLMVMPHPENFRRSWFHVRDYGLLLANPFGRHALTGGEKSAVTVQPGEALRLRFGVFVHSSPTADAFDPSAAYRAYLDAAAGE